jgi:hypothetical protein
VGASGSDWTILIAAFGLNADYDGGGRTKTIEKLYGEDDR